MHLDALFSSENELMHNIGAQQPVVLSTRIRLARNLNRHVFPGRAKPPQRQAVQTLCLSAVGELTKLKKGHIYRMNELDGSEKALLVERHLISKELASGTDGAVAISRDQTCSIMVNEEDHLRIQVVRGGFHLKRAWKQADQIDSALETQLELAYSSRLGYLTACPTNVGTGLRASAMLHLPGLMLAGQMERVVRAVNQDGLAVRGWFGEGSDASGCIFQISNQHTLGLSEPEILNHLVHWLKSIIEQEENARLCLFDEDAQKLFDRIARAYGTLRHARLLTSAEAMDALSFLRLACDLGMLPRENRALIDRLFIESQPAHIQAAASIELEPKERDFARAQLFRECFNALPELGFDIFANDRKPDATDAPADGTDGDKPKA
ncbi:MAG: protein arginine kinase [Puniceicoccales bacterium]|jgi:protein arginine kinase|nr:protein arginine kinase [Puniceicoccales bacterium]